MTPDPWGAGDLVSIAVGLVVLAVGLAINKKHRTVPNATVLLATGMSLGPLMLIILDPLAQKLGFDGLLPLVLKEGRATLWWAAVVAALYLGRDIL